MGRFKAIQEFIKAPKDWQQQKAAGLPWPEREMVKNHGSRTLGESELQEGVVPKRM